MLQQYLPFTVLKLMKLQDLAFNSVLGYVATVLTVYGIETLAFYNKRIDQPLLQQYLPFTVLKPNVTLY